MVSMVEKGGPMHRLKFKSASVQPHVPPRVLVEEILLKVQALPPLQRSMALQALVVLKMLIRLDGNRPTMASITL